MYIQQVLQSTRPGAAVPGTGNIMSNEKVQSSSLQDIESSKGDRELIIINCLTREGKIRGNAIEEST